MVITDSEVVLELDGVKSSTSTILTINLVWHFCSCHGFICCFGDQIGSWNMTWEISKNLVTHWILTQLALKHRMKECSELFWEIFSEYAAYGFGDKSPLWFGLDYSIGYSHIVAKLMVDCVYHDVPKELTTIMANYIILSLWQHGNIQHTL